jgi:hypothetical protein
MTVKYTKQETLAGEIGALVGQAGTINKTIDSKCADIRKLLRGKKIGTVKSGDAVMIRFKEAQEKLGLAEQTIKNNLTTFRKAINEGKTYDVNAIRKAKGAQTTPKAKVASVAFKGDAKVEDIVKGLRNLFNKFKTDDKTAPLASFLLDALDEYEGE